MKLKIKRKNKSKNVVRKRKEEEFLEISTSLPKDAYQQTKDLKSVSQFKY